MTEEQWQRIPEFSGYEISDWGRVYNHRTKQMMKTSRTPLGHVKINLISDLSGERLTRSVAVFVAEAFVSSPNARCDRVMILDGDQTNLKAENLVWRPRFFVWKYTHQLKVSQPSYYGNLRIVNVSTGHRYESVIETGMTEGLLFGDIWRSTYTGASIFPYGSVFEVDHRV